MRVVVTTGPSYEPVDEVRRLTNFSSGELGVMLSAQLARAGFEAICLRGVQATHPHRPAGVDFRPFTTNEDLFEQLGALAAGAGAGDVAGVFHVAALCDFKVRQVEDARGARCEAAKIESRAGGLTIVLEPARKLIGDLRRLFPQAAIVGWKYELNGDREDALDKAWRQLGENRTDACVLNGRAWGRGFGFCTPPASVVELTGKAEVAEYLTRWLERRVAATAAADR